MALSITYVFQPRTTAESEQVNINFDDIVSYLNALESTITAAGWVTTARIVDGAVTTDKIANDAVTADKLRDDASVDGNRAVTTNHVRDSGITTAKIADDAVTDAKLRDDASVDGNRAVTTDHIRNSAIVAGKLSTDAVETAKIKDANVTEAKLASGVVSKLGQNVGLRSRVSHRINGVGHTTFEDVVNVTGQGRLDGIGLSLNTSLGDYELEILVDGSSLYTLSTTADITGRIIMGAGNTTTLFQFDTSTVGNLNELYVLFHTSLQIRHRFTSSQSGNDSTAYVQYEKSA